MRESGFTGKPSGFMVLDAMDLCFVFPDFVFKAYLLYLPFFVTVILSPYTITVIHILRPFHELFSILVEYLITNLILSFPTLLGFCDIWPTS